MVDRRLLSGAVTVAWHKGTVAHASAIGRRDVAIAEPMQTNNIFRLFSMTKPVTAVAMMILWDEGKWSPADPIAKHLPELADLQVLRGIGPDCAPLLAAPEEPPTLEHLMTHQSGFSYGFTDEPVDRAFQAAGVPVIPHDITAEEYLGRLAKVPLAFEPGAGWRYSVAMDVQGIIVERLSGMRLRDFMRERIFAPLGMGDTDFFVPAAKRDRFAALYALADDALVEMTAQSDSLHYDNVAALSPSDLVLPYDQPPILASGGGGLVSTAPDYLRFGRMLLGRGELDGRRILSPEAVSLMTRSHTPPHLLTGGFGTAPHWLRPGYEYAYNGIAVTDPQTAGVALGRDTYFWDGAAGCWFWVDPTNELVFVCMVQLLADAERLSLQARSWSVVADILAGSAD
ncbi:serine hydrolase domain-containing protein [Rhizorhabdus argentea]|uniref:serine hydrolase domain-containing protein n=1 Tax=Rhizorhabdus argentea TaxID=1387174 RepID=UPI0030EB6F55